jgi:hypothetical protein
VAVFDVAAISEEYFYQGMKVVSGQWSVVSGQWSVVSGQWSVVSERLANSVFLH